MTEKFVFYCLILVIVGIFLDPDATWHYLDHAKDSITNHFYNFHICRTSFYHELFHQSLGEYEFADSFESWSTNQPWSTIQRSTSVPDATNQEYIVECSEEVTK